MTNPLVLLNNSKAFELASEFPGQIGMFTGPERLRPMNDLPYALDNGRFSVWSRGREWDESAFYKMIERYSGGIPPMWIVVPDVVGDAVATIDEWCKWIPLLPTEWPKALAVQDGMTVDTVKRLEVQPDVIFVGGTTDWKHRSLWNWCHSFPRVHCGRINTEKHWH